MMVPTQKVCIFLWWFESQKSFISLCAAHLTMKACFLLLLHCEIEEISFNYLLFAAAVASKDLGGRCSSCPLGLTSPLGLIKFFFVWIFTISLPPLVSSVIILVVFFPPVQSLWAAAEVWRPLQDRWSSFWFQHFVCFRLESGHGHMGEVFIDAHNILSCFISYHFPLEDQIYWISCPNWIIWDECGLSGQKLITSERGDSHSGF